jgi:hypothetical protein
VVDILRQHGFGYIGLPMGPVKYNKFWYHWANGKAVVFQL